MTQLIATHHARSMEFAMITAASARPPGQAPLANIRSKWKNELRTHWSLESLEWHLLWVPSSRLFCSTISRRPSRSSQTTGTEQLVEKLGSHRRQSQRAKRRARVEIIHLLLCPAGGDLHNSRFLDDACSRLPKLCSELAHY